MAKHLSDSDIEAIVELLDQWDLGVKITWEKLCQTIKDDLGLMHTRQTLEKYTRIKDTYLSVKKHASGRRRREKKLPPSLSIAAKTIERLERKNARLQQENTRLLEQFLTWQYNAHVHGMKQDQLNRPLPHKSNGKNKG